MLNVVKEWGRLARILVDRPDGHGVDVLSVWQTTITNALNNGERKHQVNEFAGHADIRSTQGYSIKRESDSMTQISTSNVR